MHKHSRDSSLGLEPPLHVGLLVSRGRGTSSLKAKEWSLVEGFVPEEAAAVEIFRIQCGVAAILNYFFRITTG